MKYYTPPLMNEVKQRKKLKAFFFGDSRRNAYYEARHKTDNVYLLWIEGIYFGKVICYPCVIERGSVLQVFENSNLPVSQENNDRLVEDWLRLVCPENVREEYEVKELDAKGFNPLFGEYRRRHLDMEMEKVMEEEIRQMPEEEQEEALQALEDAKVKNQEEVERIKQEHAEKAAKRKKKQEDAEIPEAETLDEVEDETLRQALAAAKEQAAREDEQA